MIKGLLWALREWWFRQMSILEELFKTNKRG